MLATDDKNALVAAGLSYPKDFHIKTPRIMRGKDFVGYDLPQITIRNEKKAVECTQAIVAAGYCVEHYITGKYTLVFVRVPRGSEKPRLIVTHLPPEKEQTPVETEQTPVATTNTDMDTCEECGHELCPNCGYCHNRTYKAVHQCPAFILPGSACDAWVSDDEDYERPNPLDK